VLGFLPKKNVGIEDAIISMIIMTMYVERNLNTGTSTFWDMNKASLKGMGKWHRYDKLI